MEGLQFHKNVRKSKREQISNSFNISFFKNYLFKFIFDYLKISLNQIKYFIHEDFIIIDKYKYHKIW